MIRSLGLGAAVALALAAGAAHGDGGRALTIQRYKVKSVGTQTEDGKYAGVVSVDQLPAPPVHVVRINRRGALGIALPGASGNKVVYIQQIDVDVDPPKIGRGEMCKILRQRRASTPPDQHQAGSMQLGPGCPEG